jgi:putative salt-induced outer membrane protein YdiY
MDQLLENNSNCADCDSPEVLDVNMHSGVFLCPTCALVHQKLFKTLTRKVTDSFEEEEIKFLSQKGNTKANSILMRNVMPWTVSLKTFNFQ